MSCLFGHKWMSVRDCYQYCQNCGQARKVPCAHVWEEYSRHSVYKCSIYERNISNRELADRAPDAIKYILKCTKCGELQTRIF